MYMIGFNILNMYYDSILWPYTYSLIPKLLPISLGWVAQLATRLWVAQLATRLWVSGKVMNLVFQCEHVHRCAVG